MASGGNYKKGLLFKVGVTKRSVPKTLVVGAMDDGRTSAADMSVTRNLRKK